MTTVEGPTTVDTTLVESVAVGPMPNPAILHLPATGLPTTAIMPTFNGPESSSAGSLEDVMKGMYPFF